MQYNSLNSGRNGLNTKQSNSLSYNAIQWGDLGYIMGINIQIT